VCIPRRLLFAPASSPLGCWVGNKLCSGSFDDRSVLEGRLDQDALILSIEGIAELAGEHMSALRVLIDLVLQLFDVVLVSFGLDIMNHI
jgi:hypothetical protein